VQALAKPERIAAAVALIQAAQRPVVIAGHGVLISGASRELQTFVRR